MILSFRNKALQRLFISGDTSGIKPDHIKRIRLILSMLNVASKVQDLALPGLRLHALKGKMKGFYAVDVSGNWRIIFSFQKENIIDVNYIDYH